MTGNERTGNAIHEKRFSQQNGHFQNSDKQLLGAESGNKA